MRRPVEGKLGNRFLQEFSRWAIDGRVGDHEEASITVFGEHFRIPRMPSRSKSSLIVSLFTAFLLPSSLPSLPAQPATPICLNPRNPHYFLYQGKTTALISSGEHYGAVLNLDVDYHRYLESIQKVGFNYTRLFGGSYIEVPGKSFGIQRNDLAPAPNRLLAPWARSTTPGYAGGGNKFDLGQWDPAYFKRFHDFLAEAEQRGIVVEISLFSAQYNDTQWNVSPFNPANNINQTDVTDWKKLNTLDNGKVLAFQESYTRKLVHEANGFPNVLFEIQNEPWSDRPILTDVVNPFLFPPARNLYPNSIDLPDGEALAFETRVAQWIASEESSLPNKHLIAQNYSNFRLPVRQLIPGVSIVNFHYAYPEAVTLNYGLNKALSYDETGFLGREDQSYIRQAWNFMLSGGSTFNGLDYSFSPGHEDGSDTAPNGPGGGSPELRRQLNILHQFLNELPLVEMAPDPQTVKQGQGVFTRALASPSGHYAIYLDGSGPSELLLTLAKGDYAVQWTDIHTGASTESPGFHHPGGNKTLSTPEFKDGIAVRLTRTK